MIKMEIRKLIRDFWNISAFFIAPKKTYIGGCPQLSPTAFHSPQTANGGAWTPGRIALLDILGSPTADDAPDYEYIQTLKIGGWSTTPDYRIHIKPSEKGVIDYYMWKTIEP